MDSKTLAALESSITKWDAVAAGTMGCDGADNCSLCTMFLRQDVLHVVTCAGCPVYELTKKTGCADTPYTVWSHLSDNETPRKRGRDRKYLPGWFARSEQAKRVARAEANFLRALLPR